MERSFGPETPVLMYGTAPRFGGALGSGEPRSCQGPEMAAVAGLGVSRCRPEISATPRQLAASRCAGDSAGQSAALCSDCRTSRDSSRTGGFRCGRTTAQGHLDEHGNVTRRALDLLDDDQAESTSFQVAWVFRDPWRQRLWPFLAESLEYAATSRAEEGHVQLEFGTTGKPYHQRVWSQRPPDDATPTAPDAREILQAASRHARLVRRNRRTASSEDESAAPPELKDVDINRIALIEPDAQPVFLVTYLYVPQSDQHADGDWHACDFFGRGSNPELRELVSRVARSDESLARHIDPILARSYYENSAEFRRIADARRNEAEQRIQAALTLSILDSSVYRTLVDAMEAWLEADFFGDGAGSRRQRNVLATCRRVLEGLFANMRKAYSLVDVAKRLPRDDKSVRRSILQRAYQDLGFTDIPDSLLNIKPGHVHAVSNYDDTRLRPLVAATSTASGAVPGTSIPIGCRQGAKPASSHRRCRRSSKRSRPRFCRRVVHARCYSEMPRHDAGNRRGHRRPTPRQYATGESP
jgi:hypothetical protein